MVYEGLKNHIINRTERHYAEFRDSNNQLVDPTSPLYTVYNPHGIYYSSGAPTKESTGVYYIAINLSSSSAAVCEGMWSIWWEGTISGAQTTMDTPHYFYAKYINWQLSPPDEIIQTVRRLVGDTNPNNYRISTQDMYYFLKDAVEIVCSELDWNNTVSVTPTSVSFGDTPVSGETSLYKLKTLILVKESILSDSLYDGGSVSVGDIKVDVTGIIRERQSNLKRLIEEYDKLMKLLKMNSIEGCEIDTHVTGVLYNATDSVDSKYWTVNE